MNTKNVQDVTLTLAWVKGAACLFSEERIDSQSIPEGFYKYDIRHADGDCSWPCTLEDRVAVNYYGAVLMREPLDFGDTDYVDISAEGQFVDSGDVVSIDEFLKDQQPEKNERGAATMRVLVVEPLQAPYAKEITHELEAMQKIVGGTIQATYPYADPVAIVCNDDGKLIGLQPNRVLRDRNGTPYDYIAGTFFICGLKTGDFASIPQDLEQKYARLFRGEMLMPEPPKPKRRKPKSPER